MKTQLIQSANNTRIANNNNNSPFFDLDNTLNANANRIHAIREQIANLYYGNTYQERQQKLFIARQAQEALQYAFDTSNDEELAWEMEMERCMTLVGR